MLALNIYVRFHQALYNKAKVLMHLKRYAEALKELDIAKMVALNPEIVEKLREDCLRCLEMQQLEASFKDDD